jgi:poly(3-hydroxyalkanoate) synthetase
MPVYLALCVAGTPAIAEATCVERQRAAAVCQRGDVIIAGAYQCACSPIRPRYTRLRKRWSSLEPGPAQLPALTCAATGDAPQVKQGALRVGEDLAVTSGSVVYRDALCEVIQSVVAY